MPGVDEKNCRQLENTYNLHPAFCHDRNRALQLPGFDEKSCARAASLTSQTKTALTVGFGHQAVLSVAGQVGGRREQGRRSGLLMCPAIRFTHCILPLAA